MCLILGLIIGEIDSILYLGALGDSIENWLALDPNTILVLFLPPLIFESASSLNFHTFKYSIYQSIILAGTTLFKYILYNLILI